MNVPTHFSITAIDNIITIGDVPIPKGLVLNVQLDAESLAAALEYSQQAANYFLSSLSCTCNAAVGQPKPLWGYDATTGLEERELQIIVYDYKLHISTRRLDKRNWFALLNQMFNGTWLTTNQSRDLTQRLQRAIQSFRRGLADTEDILDEFLIHWSSLETLDVVYRRVFNHEAAHHFKVCGKCKTNFLYCPVCGDDQTFRVRQRYTGIEDVFAALDQPEKYSELNRLRNGISHGYMSIDQCMAAAIENIELVRKAVLSMIMRIVGVEDEMQASILGQLGLKGKFIPHFRQHLRGVFEPGDPFRFDTHPQIDVIDAGIEVKKHGDKLALNPSWRITPKNCSITYRGCELFGDDAASFEIEEGVRFKDI
jgi:hypothetical protein